MGLQQINEQGERVSRMTKPGHRIEYSPEVAEHLSSLTARQSARVLESVVRQLVHEPTRVTRNRKLLRANNVAPWELRIGDLRVYYEVRSDPEPLVLVLAVGIKERERVRIGGAEVEL